MSQSPLSDQITNTTSCDCYKSCDDTTFQVTNTARTNSTLGRSIRYEVTPSKMRFRRDVQFRIWEVLVSFGNCTCLFMGISGISIIEFVFFYFIHIVQAYNKYKQN